MIKRMAYTMAALFGAVVLALSLAPGAASAQGDLNCDDFSSWGEAQAEFVSNLGDPHNLDADDDGIACEARQDYTEPVTGQPCPKLGLTVPGLKCNEVTPSDSDQPIKVWQVYEPPATETPSATEQPELPETSGVRLLPILLIGGPALIGVGAGIMWRTRRRVEPVK